MSDVDRPVSTCFLAISNSPEFEDVRRAVSRAATLSKLKVVSYDDFASQLTLWNNDKDTTGELARADCVVADLTDRNPNVLYELGIATAMGKPVIVIANRESRNPLASDLGKLAYISYDLANLDALTSNLRRTLTNFRRLPSKRVRYLTAATTPPFFVDWDSLEQSEAENLCLELLTQMGFRNTDWIRGGPADLVAELPRKDPDGFEYRELWIVSLGRNGPPDRLLDMAIHDTKYLHDFISMTGRKFSRRLSRTTSEEPTTLLMIQLSSTTEIQIESVKYQVNKFSKERMFAFGLRVRVWDRTYLTSLVQQFPQIGYKYFSDEGRFRSQHRKTPEEIYRENVQLTERLASTYAELKQEKDGRARAERDAVWKDLAFVTAHKLGNPLFALEAYLGPLRKRISEKKADEALQVVGSMQTTVEKAKGIIAQFKSLSLAQKISPIPLSLYQIVDEALQVARENGVTCSLNCAPDTKVLGDPDRLPECFDELVSNSLCWMQGDSKEIRVDVVEAKEPPPGLDGMSRYVLIKFQDNGPGIPPERKSEIFNAFMATREHGAGLGLAYVRRIIEGHAGLIFESGTPGREALFQIYLPSATETKSEFGS